MDDAVGLADKLATSDHSCGISGGYSVMLVRNIARECDLSSL